MIVTVDTFNGMAPKASPRLLPNTASQNANNCRLDSGALMSWRDTSFVRSFSAGTRLAIYLYAGTYWYAWGTDVNVVKTPIAGDEWNRIYWTGDGGVPKMAASDMIGSGTVPNSYDLGVPAPLAVPTLTVSGTIAVVSQTDTYAIPVSPYQVTVILNNYFTADVSVKFVVGGTTLTKVAGTPSAGQYSVSADGVYTFAAADTGKNVLINYTYTQSDPTMIETRSYVYTYVSAYGEEGPPCLASNTVDVAPGQTVNLTGLDTGASGSHHLSTKRIYRTNTGSSSTQYQFVAEIPLATTTYADSIASSALGEVMLSLAYDPPPADLSGLISLPFGSLAGFSGNELCFSEPYEPHAWPVNYRIPVDYPIVAIGAFGTSILVTTTGTPYIVSGQAPGSMMRDKAENGQACVSKRGLVDMGSAIIYPGADGLWLAGPGVLQKVTEKLLTRQEWQQLYYPDTLTGCMYDGKYFGFWKSGGTSGGFVFNPSTGDLTNLDLSVDATFLNPLDGQLYILQGINVNKWDAASTYKNFTWKSKVFPLTRPINMSAAKVVAEAYPVTFKFLSNGVQKLSVAVANENPFPLPSGFLSNDFEFELSSTGAGYVAVNKVIIAENMEDILTPAYGIGQQV